MSSEGRDINGIPENVVENAVEHVEKASGMNLHSDGDLRKENDANPSLDDTHDRFLQMVAELKFENEYLKSHFVDLKNLHIDSGGSYQQTRAFEQDGRSCEDVHELHDRIESLNKELLEEKQTRGAAEEAMKHLQAVYTEADAKSQELSAKLAEGCTFPYILECCLIVHCSHFIICDVKLACKIKMFPSSGFA